jgi:aspartyl-tRNA(Asn)/glutamyl-tRNA(Gln) amidotransferase subunit B
MKRAKDVIVLGLMHNTDTEWKMVIGLEIHAQVSTQSKLFSRSSAGYGGAPNSHVSFIDAAMPGMLPTLNQYAIEQAVKTGLGLNAVINKTSVFDRKNYFYADLPQGYQISQFYKTIVGEGYLDITLKDGTVKKIGIRGMHLEQDAGKSLHDQSPTESLIDLNRSGVALMEIVTHPDLSSAEETSEFLKNLRSILRYLGTCDGDMEKGSMRCDANISMHRKGTPFGTRCEVKNLNSIKNVMRAIEFESKRQIEILEAGGEIIQETRLFNADTGETRTLRTKENSDDYRYFPDPDLLPVILTDEYIETIRANMPELPDAKRKRYIDTMGLSQYDAAVLVADEEVTRYFETVGEKVNPKLAANWITGELFGRLNKTLTPFAQSKVTPTHLIRLIELIEDGTISNKIAKDLFDHMFETGEDPALLVEQKGLRQVVDKGAIEALVESVLSNNQDKVQEYKQGKDKLFGFFVGQVMKESGGKMNPTTVNEVLKDKLR